MKSTEGLRSARLLMVLSSISPLFVIWGISGNSLVPDRYFVTFCVLMVLVPNSALWLRIFVANWQQDKRALVVGTAEDHRDHMLVYLFAMLLPFYSQDMATIRDFTATIAALVFIVFLFWHLNLHYMNIAFAVIGYRVFTVTPPTDEPHSSKARYALITKRSVLDRSDRVVALRLSNTVYLERD